MRANGELIADAPTMLAMLQNCLPTMEDTLAEMTSRGVAWAKTAETYRIQCAEIRNLLTRHGLL